MREGYPLGVVPHVYSPNSSQSEEVGEVQATVATT